MRCGEVIPSTAARYGDHLPTIKNTCLIASLGFSGLSSWASLRAACFRSVRSLAHASSPGNGTRGLHLLLHSLTDPRALIFLFSPGFSSGSPPGAPFGRPLVPNTIKGVTRSEKQPCSSAHGPRHACPRGAEAPCGSPRGWFVGRTADTTNSACKGM